MKSRKHVISRLDSSFSSLSPAASPSSSFYDDTFTSSPVLEQQIRSVHDDLQEMKQQLKSAKNANAALRRSLDVEKAAVLDAQQQLDMEIRKRKDAESITKLQRDEHSLAKHLLSKLRPIWRPASEDDFSLEQLNELDKECHHWFGVHSVKNLLAEILTVRTSKPPRGKKSVFDTQEWCLLWLMHVHRGYTYVTLSYWANLDDSTIRSSFQTIQALFLTWSMREVRFPEISEWHANTDESYTKEYGHELPLFIDGTVIPIFKPTNGEIQKEAFNKKHAMHALSFSILCTTSGKIVWVSDCDLGNMHDTTAWSTSRCAYELHEKYRNIASVAEKSASCPQLVISGDQAYRKILLPKGWIARITVSGSTETPTQETTESTSVEQNADALPTPHANLDTSREPVFIPDERSSKLDPLIARWRSIVERAFARMKSWEFFNCRHLTSRNVASVQQIPKIVAALCNWELSATRRAMGMSFTDNDHRLYGGKSSSSSFEVPSTTTPHEENGSTKPYRTRSQRNPDSILESPHVPLNEFLQQISSLDFINEDFIENLTATKLEKDSEIVQGVAVGLNRIIGIENLDDGALLIKGAIRSKMLKTWYETHVLINDDRTISHQCACVFPYVLIVFSEFNWLFLTFNVVVCAIMWVKFYTRFSFTNVTQKRGRNQAFWKLLDWVCIRKKIYSNWDSQETGRSGETLYLLKSHPANWYGLERSIERGRPRQKAHQSQEKSIRKRSSIRSNLAYF